MFPKKWRQHTLTYKREKFMRYMKQKCALCLLCFAFSAVLSLSACAGAADWTYDDLPGGYEIHRNSSNSITLCKPTEDAKATTEILIGSYVDMVAVHEQYIAAQQVNPAERADAGKSSNVLEKSYFLLDTDSEELVGPLDEFTFLETCKQLNITDFPLWINTTDLENN